MTRPNYGTLRGNPRRAGGAWQWVVIGFVVGFGCAAIIGLVAIIGGLDPGGLLTANRPTQTPFVITNTPLPVTPTPEPTEVLLVATATATLGQVVVAPSATPTTDPASIQVQPSATPTAEVEATQDTSANNLSAAGSGNSEVPSLLVGLLTQMNQVSGGTFPMGTTPQEVQTGVTECQDVFEANCDITMGEDSAPVHNVTVDSFMMDVTEVTYQQYMAFLNSMGPRSHLNGCNGQPCIKTRAEDPNSNVIFDSANYRVVDVINNFPVAGVTWYGAQAYCEAIGGRLPTEAEWERAARGPENFLYPWGNTFSTDNAKTSRPRVDPSLAGATAIGSYAAGAGFYGMLDMAGNVAEWVSDWYSPTYYSQLSQSGQAVLNPQGPPAGTEKTVRGGSWDTPPFFARAVHRQSWAPQDGTLWLGFRCVAPVGAGGANTTGNTGNTGTTGNTGATTNPTALPAGGADEEGVNNAQPTLQPPPSSNQPLPTLNPGG